MLDALKSFLEEAFGTPESGAAAAPSEEDLRLAAAALLVEIVRADFEVGEEESREAAHVLAEHFQLERDAAEALLADAGDSVDQAVSLHEFTRVLHENLTEAEKLRIFELMARVAAVDGELDKHERHLLGKVGELLYLRRSDYLVVQQRVVEAFGGKE